MPETTTWPYDAAEHDPLTALRIPVATDHPDWKYIATFDRSSEARPTDAEAAQLASFIAEYKHYFFNAGYIARLEEKPFDHDSATVTRIFHKWGEGDWSYRLRTWEYGPFWVPVAPWQRGGKWDQSPLKAPLTLAQVMGRVHTIGDGEPMKHWVEWKAARPEVFGDA
jgi:hypothetical protein